MRRVLVASCAGTMIEWYDFFIFGSLATILAQQFYPPDNPTAGLLQTLATFAVGFLIRPLGALFFGRMGDRVGRKTAFMTTLLLMGGATTAIGLLPGHGKIGILAPIALVVLRLAQGLAIGGEYGGANVYVAEHAPQARRGYYTSFIYTTATVGLLLSLIVIVAVRTIIGEAAFEAWGWRIPFLLSAVLVALSYYIRKRLSESPIFTELKGSGRTSSNPIRDSFAESRWKIILVLMFGLIGGHSVVWYTGQFYALFFLQTVLKVPMNITYNVMAFALLLGTPCFVFFGWLSDRISRPRIILTGLALAALTYYPLYHAMSWAVSTSNFVVLTLLIVVQIVFAAMSTGPLAAVLIDTFPPQIRYTSVSFAHHTGNGLFGGFLPLIAAALVAQTGDRYAGLWYPIGIATMGFVIGAIFLRRLSRQKIA